MKRATAVCCTVRGLEYRGRKHVIRSAVDFRSRFFAIFIVKYTRIIPCRVVHSEYIFQLRNHARNGACRSHWSTTGLILCGWPNKNFKLNIIDSRRRGLWRGRKYIKIVLKITLYKIIWSFGIVKEWKITNLFFIIYSKMY